MPATSASEISSSVRAHFPSRSFCNTCAGMSDRPTASSDFLGARALAAQALAVDLQAAAAHVAASSTLPQLLILQRQPSQQFPLNRNWAHPHVLQQAARRYSALNPQPKSITPKTLKLNFQTLTPNSAGFDARVVTVAGMGLHGIAQLFCNVSAVLGVTGDDLGHVWWMGAAGGVLVHVRPYGYGNHSGLEFNAMAQRAGVQVLDVHLQPHHAQVAAPAPPGKCV
jgi:hypothetical protein